MNRAHETVQGCKAELNIVITIRCVLQSVPSRDAHTCSFVFFSQTFVLGCIVMAYELELAVELRSVLQV